MEKMYNDALANMEKAQSTQAKYYNKRHRNVEYLIGDLVLLKTFPKSSKEKRFAKKFADRWEGPHRIIEKCSPVTYRTELVADPEISSVYNIMNMKPYFDRPDELIYTPQIQSRSFINSRIQVKSKQNIKKTSPVQVRRNLRNQPRVNYARLAGK